MIDENEQNKLYQDAIEAWGVSSQLNMVTEECSELLMAINKYRRNPCEETENAIAGEMADVEIMFGELKIIFKNNDAVSKIKQIKLDRLKERLKTGYSQKDKTSS